MARLLLGFPPERSNHRKREETMEQSLEKVTPQVHRSRISVPYSWWAGDTASRFFVNIRDEKRISGTRCEQCNKVYIPPRKTCPACFTANENWVDVASSGTLISYTVARRQLRAIPKKVPVIFGLIRLDGADTAMLHYIDEIDPQQVAIGMRLEAVFAEARSGGIQDIRHFRPEQNSD
jgi:uncharacterized OB-fold protein